MLKVDRMVIENAVIWEFIEIRLNKGYIIHSIKVSDGEQKSSNPFIVELDPFGKMIYFSFYCCQVSSIPKRHKILPSITPVTNTELPNESNLAIDTFW